MEAKKWWMSKTIQVGVAEILVGMAGFLTTLPPEVSITAIVTGILMIVLRVVTKQPIK